MKKKSNKQSVDEFFDYGIDVEKRIIYMGSMNTDWDNNESGVDFSMAEYVIKGLVLLDLKAPDGDEPITIIMNNPGGDWYHGMAIYDAIKSCKNKINIVVYGMAMSMGSIILQAADVRILAPNAKFMIHYGYWGIGMNHPKIALKWAEEEKKIEKTMEEIYMEKIRNKHPKFKASKLKKMLDFDTILTADETVELGLADAVLGKKVT